MWILAYFTQDGEPALGLSPVVTIRDVETGNIVISGAGMVEKGDGFYGYYFSSFNPEQDYAIICDSVTLSGVERYTYAASGEYHDVLNEIESTVGIVDLRTDLLRKVQTNRLELFDGDTDNWILYDDDGTTPLLTFSVSDKNGDIIVQCPNTPSRRSHAKGLVISGSGTPEIYMRKSVYDPDNNGYVNAAESITDGIHTSTAIQVKDAVNKAHSSYQLGTKYVTESGIADGKVLAYDSALGKLVYTTISGIIPSGISDHGQLTGLLDDDHPQYILVNGSRGFTSAVAGVDPVQGHDLATKNYIDTRLAVISGSIITKHGQLNGLSDDDHQQYILVDGTRNFSGVVSYASHPSFTVGTQLVDKEYVDSVVQGLDWQGSVKNFQGTAPVSPAFGDRYVVISGTGVWAGHDYDIAEWNGSSWDFTTPNEGFAVWDETDDRLMVYNGSEWVRFGSTANHNYLNGLQGGTIDEYYHLTQTSYNTLTSVGGINNASSEHIHDDRYYTESEVDVISGSLDRKIIESVSNIYTAYYLHAEYSDIIDYRMLLDEPSNDDESYVETVVSVTDGEVLASSHVTASGVPGVTHIVSGMWVWTLWADVNSVSQGPHYLRAKWYRREQDGTEHFLFAQQQEITSTIPAKYYVETAASGIIMQETDRLVLKIYAETAANSDRRIRYYLEGTEHATRYETPVYNKCRSDHGYLSGLGDDDHLQYVRVDGNRGFSATVSGVDPLHSYDLATKNYVDSRTVYRVYEHGRQAIASGVSQVTVTFASELGNTDYTINAALENTVDSPPAIYAFIITSKATTGFTATLAGTTESANYVLDWAVIP